MNLEKLSLIGRKTYKYNDNIIINIPTLKQVRGDNEEEENLFWGDVNMFVQTPSDMISELDSMGMDFEKLSDYDLFTLFFMIKKENDNPHKSILFQNFSLWNLNLQEIDGKFVLQDTDGNIIIDETVYDDISKIISMLTGHKKTPKKKFGNAFEKKKRIKHD